MPRVSDDALAFDLYGTLVDPIRVWRQLEHHVGNSALRVSELWRQKQLEYTFRLTAMEQYKPFDEVTRKALDYALTACGQSIAEPDRPLLLAQYDTLEPFLDVRSGLERLRAAGYRMVVFSNGTPHMLRTAVSSAAIAEFFDDLISVDEVHVYKPSPRVYRHLASRLNLTANQVRLISSNPFDVIGAAAVGMHVAWIDRTNGVFDTLGTRPALVVRTLVDLANELSHV